jgi:hypothetical protein
MGTAHPGGFVNPAPLAGMNLERGPEAGAQVTAGGLRPGALRHGYRLMTCRGLPQSVAAC